MLAFFEEIISPNTINIHADQYERKRQLYIQVLKVDDLIRTVQKPRSPKRLKDEKDKRCDGEIETTYPDPRLVSRKMQEMITLLQANLDMYGMEFIQKILVHRNFKGIENYLRLVSPSTSLVNENDPTTLQQTMTNSLRYMAEQLLLNQTQGLANYSKQIPQAEFQDVLMSYWMFDQPKLPPGKIALDNMQREGYFFPTINHKMKSARSFAEAGLTYMRCVQASRAKGPIGKI